VESGTVKKRQAESKEKATVEKRKEQEVQIMKNVR